MPVNTASAPDLDRQVLAACQRGEREAFHHLFEKYKDRVFSTALYFSGNEATARDVTQEVFLKLFTRIVQFRGDANFSTWLYRMVANACVDQKRKVRRLVPLDTELDHSRHLTRKPQEKGFFRREIADKVQIALQTLKPSLRIPLVLRYVEGLSYQEIGDALGCSAGTVASRLNRGHRILAKKLGHLRGVVDPGL
jgi:RNA polymerase sigma-70 factor (ECF subfamily)